MTSSSSTAAFLISGGEPASFWKPLHPDLNHHTVAAINRWACSWPHPSAAYLPVHRDGWRRVADAVHAKGGLIFQQLYHLGRKSDPSRMSEGTIPVAPSAIAARGQVAGINGPVDFAVPRAL